MSLAGPGIGCGLSRRKCARPPSALAGPWGRPDLIGDLSTGLDSVQLASLTLCAPQALSAKPFSAQIQKWPACLWKGGEPPPLWRIFSRNPSKAALDCRRGQLSARMPQILKNPWRGRGLGLEAPMPVDDAGSVAQLLAQCPAHAVTPLRDVPALAGKAGVARLLLKDERSRMGLGSFKALGAAYAIAREAGVTGSDDWGQALAGRVYVTASAGNHGLSVAVGARLFGAHAVIYIAESVPEVFAERLKAKGADIVRAGASYEASMQAAAIAAEAQGWTLLSDSSWPGYSERPLRVMEGYLQLAAEVESQIDTPPSHILLQAGVGGLAAAMAAYARRVWGDDPEIIVVEPELAPALMESVRRGRVVEADGPASCMGRLDCKTPSLIALNGLSRDADLFVTLTEAEAQNGAAELEAHGLPTTPSGAAGVAALLAGLDLPPDAKAMAILSEGPEDG